MIVIGRTEADDLKEIMRIINVLTRCECSSVEFIADNQDFGGPDCAIRVHWLCNIIKPIMVDRIFFAETTLECLTAAESELVGTESFGE